MPASGPRQQPAAPASRRTIAWQVLRRTSSTCVFGAAHRCVQRPVALASRHQQARTCRESLLRASAHAATSLAELFFPFLPTFKWDPGGGRASKSSCMPLMTTSRR